MRETGHGRRGVGRQAALGAATVCLLLAAGCGRKKESAPAAEGPREEDMSWGAVALTVTADPPRVNLKTDTLLTFRITAPSEMDVFLSALDDRVEGFVVSGTFDGETTHADGKSTQVRHVRLTPVLSDVYRLKPIPVRYVDRSTSPARSGWFPSRPIEFESSDGLKGVPGKAIEPVLEPLWIYPAFKTVAFYVLLVLLAGALTVLAWKLLRRLRRHVELMRMSPKERALRELAMLLARDLVSRDRVKDFYLELTMIVRRYIERQHAVRAPEQTTEEFLAAVAGHPRFSAEVVARLRAFLVASDLVKFAGDRPERPLIDKATDTAREYVETDAAGEPGDEDAGPENGGRRSSDMASRTGPGDGPARKAGRESPQAC